MNSPRKSMPKSIGHWDRSPNALRLCLFGAAPDTGNRGVSALALSAVSEIVGRVPDAQITVFDHRRGCGEATFARGNSIIAYRRSGAVFSRRLHRPESFWHIRLAARFNLRNAAASAIRNADAVLDVSAGDSFTDLYGWRRFRAVTTPKLIALDLGRPLILLPQTYGPFRSRAAKRIAQTIVRAAAMAWARDHQSFEALCELLGDAYDPRLHRCGVDMAMALEAQRPTHMCPELSDCLSESQRTPVIGLNVSGLLYNDPTSSRRFALRADYRAAMHRLVERLLSDTSTRILLVPHVMPARDPIESDSAAMKSLVQSLTVRDRARVISVSGELDARELKWIIARTCWFCGTRMHAAIAALSSGVPASAIAYSGKTAGVFETLGQARHVADARNCDTTSVVEQVWQSWLDRAQARASLAANVPGVFEQAHAQMDDVLRRCAQRNETIAIGAAA
jgi:colanic acid/amylovoran biosynthesis protein